MDEATLKRYVVGYLFRDSLRQVAMLTKKRPGWQAGLLNGPGGKIEPGETDHQAICREFWEETGHFRHDWCLFCQSVWDGGYVNYYVAADDGTAVLVSKTDEEVDWYLVSDVRNKLRAVPDTLWTIPMAIRRLHQPFFAKVTHGACDPAHRSIVEHDKKTLQGDS
jgi:8-oxo-dGTP pyrophosphatase MutT (NUDIX family)